MTDEQRIDALLAAMRRDGSDDEAEAVVRLRQRTEQAEMERDEARAALAQAVKVVAETHMARERAEADNAALLDSLRRAESELSDAVVRHHGIDAVLSADHPGAALLERMRALEAAITKHKSDVWGEGAVGHHHDVALYDALRLPRE